MGSNENVQVLEVRETIEEQSQDNLTQESVTPGQKDLVLAECLIDVCQQELSCQNNQVPGFRCQVGDWGLLWVAE